MLKKRLFCILIIIVLVVFISSCDKLENSPTDKIPDCIKYDCLKDTDDDGIDCKENNINNMNSVKEEACEYSTNCVIS